MKITRRQLRRIIREEAARPFPIDYYPEEMLIQEGLWDAISNLLGSIVGFFSDAWNEAESQFDSQISGYRSDYMGSNWDSLVKTMDPEGEGDPPDMKKVDFQDEKYAPAYWGYWTEAAPKMLDSMLKKLKATESVKDWVPPEGTKPEDWMKGDGKAALGVNKAFGEIIAMIADLEKATPELKGVADKMRAMKPEDAGKAATGIVDGVKAIAGSSALKRAAAALEGEVGEALPNKGDPGAAQTGLESVSTLAQQIIAKIEEDAKKQEDALQDAAESGGGDATEEVTKEWINLRRHINAMIITERRKIT